LSGAGVGYPVLGGGMMGRCQWIGWPEGEFPNFGRLDSPILMLA
jgi:hypothetical protein